MASNLNYSRILWSEVEFYVFQCVYVFFVDKVACLHELTVMVIIFNNHDDCIIKKEVTLSGMSRKNIFHTFLKIALIAIRLTLFMHRKNFHQLLVIDCRILKSL